MIKKKSAAASSAWDIFAPDAPIDTDAILNRAHNSMSQRRITTEDEDAPEPVVTKRSARPSGTTKKPRAVDVTIDAPEAAIAVEPDTPSMSFAQFKSRLQGEIKRTGKGLYHLFNEGTQSIPNYSYPDMVQLCGYGFGDKRNLQIPVAVADAVLQAYAVVNDKFEL